MANSSNSSSSGMISGINVTPLVDITLVLLIIFMVTAKLVMAPQAAMKLNLPPSSTSEQVIPIFAVTLERDGGIRVNGRRLDSDNAVATLARNEHTNHPDVRAVI